MRKARIKAFSTDEGWYHLYASTSGERESFPLEAEGSKDKLVNLVKYYSQIYYCELASYAIMGNHYHLVVKFEPDLGFETDDFVSRIKKLYPNNFQKQLDDRHRRRQLRQRLLNVSELMRQIQSAFTRWYNRNFDRRGSFWADRFKSTLLIDEHAVKQCMMYVDLNPVRAGLCTRPEEYAWCSLFERKHNDNNSLYDLSGIVVPDGLSLNKRYAEDVSIRFASPPKKIKGLRSESRSFVDGLIVGSKSAIADYLESFFEQGWYQKKRVPIHFLDSSDEQFCLRSQRRRWWS